MNVDYSWGLPIPASTYAGEIDWELRLLHGAMAVIFLSWAFYFSFLLVRYKRREGVPARVLRGSLWRSLGPGLAIGLLETAFIAFVEIPGWDRIKIRGPRPEDSNVVEVAAEQYVWNIHYPGKDGKFGRVSLKFLDSNNEPGLDPRDPDGKDDVVVQNQLHVPLGKPTLIHLSSRDVIHSFFVPEFRVKQDAVPGLSTLVWFEPTRAGKFEVVCSQLCGLGHSYMKGDVYVETPKEFDAWLRSKSRRIPNGMPR